MQIHSFTNNMLLININIHTTEDAELKRNLFPPLNIV